MTSVPHGHLPYGETGAGTFGNRLGKQNDGYIAAVKDQILEFVDSFLLKKGKKNTVFTLGDYGTADGASSMNLIRALVGLIREKWGEVPIQIIHEDQSSNDFNSLFKRLHGFLPDPPTYLNDFQNLYVMASGTSFYQQVMPDNSADLIISFIAVHWLSEKPLNYQNSMRRVGASDEERKVVEIQAIKDLETFLLLRARELKPGGLLIISTPSDDEEQVEKSALETAAQHMLTIWRQMRDEGKITADEFLNSNFNFSFRYLDEMKAPFEDSDSAVYKAGLRLVSSQIVFPPSLAQQEWKEKLDKEGVDERANFAKIVVDQNRCWSNSSFAEGLDKSRSESEKESLVDEMYARAAVAMSPTDPSLIEHQLAVSYIFVQKV